MSRKSNYFHVLMCLAFMVFSAGIAQGVAIPDSAGTIVLQDGPNAEGFYFDVTVHYEAFDGQDASDPLGVTPGKNQFAYILEYNEGNEPFGRWTVESINGVALLDTGVATTGTVNGVDAGTLQPFIKAITTLTSGNPAAYFDFSNRGISNFIGAGTRSVILVFTASNEHQIGEVLGIGTDNSLSAADKVVGPVDCSGSVAGNVSCNTCEPDGSVIPMEGVTVTALQGGVEVVSIATDKNGQYEIADLDPGDYTVTVVPGADIEACSVTSVDVTVSCEESGYASFCLCPVCEQELCIEVKCEETGEPIAKTWVIVCGPDGLMIWRCTDENGMVCLSGAKIVPGTYKIKIKPGRNYQVNGPVEQTVELASCEKKQVTFNVCPPPPCEPQVCVSVVAVNEAGEEYPLLGVELKLAKIGQCHEGVTDADGNKCFADVTEGFYIASLKMPQGYRRCSGEEKCVRFRLDRCEQREIKFVLCEIQSTLCPESPGFWKNHPDIWPVESLELGGVAYTKDELLNFLDNNTVDGVHAARDMSIKLARFLVAAKLSILDGSDPTDIESVIAAADEFLTHNAPGSRPGGRARKCARDIKNSLDTYVNDRSACEGGDSDDNEGNGDDTDDTDGDDGAVVGGEDDSGL